MGEPTRVPRIVSPAGPPAPPAWILEDARRRRVRSTYVRSIRAAARCGRYGPAGAILGIVGGAGLAEAMTLDERTYRRHVARLREWGWLVVVERMHLGPAGQTVGHTYAIPGTREQAIPRIAAEKPAERAGPTLTTCQGGPGQVVRDPPDKMSGAHDGFMASTKHGSAPRGRWSKWRRDRRGRWRPPHIEPDLLDGLDLDRIRPIFLAACRAGVWENVEATGIQFVASAVKARRVGHDPPRLFANLLTQLAAGQPQLPDCDYDRAVELIKRARDAAPERREQTIQDREDAAVFERMTRRRPSRLSPCSL